MEVKTVLVTGAGGFLGSYIVKELLKNNYQVIGLARNSYPELVELGVKFIKCDLAKTQEVNELDLSGVDAIIHSAAIAGVWGDKDKFYKTNLHGSISLLNKAKEANIKYFIYTSSPSVVFGEEDIINATEDLSYPHKFYTHYANTKAQAEKEILKEGLVGDIFTLALRPHLIWGPGDPHLIPRILAKAKSGRLKRVGSGENLVDIIYVENAAIAHVKSLEALIENTSLSGNAYFLGQEKPVNLWDFINDILTRKGLDPVKGSVSFKLAFYVGLIFEGLFSLLGIVKPEPPMTRFIALQLAKSHYFSHQKAKNDFGYSPEITIEEGLLRSFTSA